MREISRLSSHGGRGPTAERPHCHSPRNNTRSQRVDGGRESHSRCGARVDAASLVTAWPSTAKASRSAFGGRRMVTGLMRRARHVCSRAQRGRDHLDGGRSSIPRQSSRRLRAGADVKLPGLSGGSRGDGARKSSSSTNRMGGIRNTRPTFRYRGRQRASTFSSCSPTRFGLSGTSEAPS